MRSAALITNRARTLRKAMSEPEVMLWSRLRGREPGRPTFRRQHPIGSIILDFYCPSCRLAVEIDGSTHGTEEAMWTDRARDHWLGAKGSPSCVCQGHSVSRSVCRSGRDHAAGN